MLLASDNLFSYNYLNLRYLFFHFSFSLSNSSTVVASLLISSMSAAILSVKCLITKFYSDFFVYFDNFDVFKIEFYVQLGLVEFFKIFG